MNLLNSIFDLDWNEIIKTYKKYVKVFVIMFLILVLLLVIKKDYYYDSIYIKNQDSFLLVVEKDIVDNIKNNNHIVVNNLNSDYSINSIIDNGDNCYIDISLKDDIDINQNGKYKIYLGKETFIEYIIRIMKKV